MTQSTLPPLILTAFSTNESTLTTNRQLEQAVTSRFPTRTVLWGYNQRTVAREHRKGNREIRQPKDILHELAAAGCTAAVVQSLHLLPGHEFHELHHEVRHVTAIASRIGMPLFSSPEDYHLLIELLTPLARQDEEQALLLIGHGTRHPVWTAYVALEHLLQHRFGDRAFVGVLEHFPPSEDVGERILAAGYSRVLLIPFFFSGGVHIHRDMLGEADHSWLRRLQRLGLKVTAVQDGIGLLPGIGELVIRHIEEADQLLMTDRNTGEKGAAADR